MLGLRSIVQMKSFKSVEETRGYTRTVHTRTRRALPHHTSLVGQGQAVGSYVLWNSEYHLLRIPQC
jgi:hypothetical protein